MHVVTGELRKATYIKDNCGKDGQSKMYVLELSEVIKDYQTNEKSYTNYSAMIFASSQGQRDYYDQSLVEGNWVSLTAEKLKIDVSECGQYVKLRMENARVENTGYIQNNQQQQAPQQARQPQQQGSYNQQYQNQPNGGFAQPANQQQQRQAQQGGYTQQGQQKGRQHQQSPKANQQEPSIDFDDPIPF